MLKAILEKEYKTMKVENEEFVMVPKKEFLKLKRDYSKLVDEEYPKLYIEKDEEWTWEGIDFWSEGIDPKEIINHLRS